VLYSSIEPSYNRSLDLEFSFAGTNWLFFSLNFCTGASIC
jgi:hypothetical protein